jgi:hypothetical protein
VSISITTDLWRRNALASQYANRNDRQDEEQKPIHE